jgi:hypothetical protein
MEPPLKKVLPAYSDDIIAKYKKYGVVNKVFGVNYIPEDINDYLLVTMCNEYHQKHLLRIWKYRFEHLGGLTCYNSGKEHIFVLKNSALTCKCGRIWNWYTGGFDWSNIKKFNIDCTSPYGELVEV